MAMSASYLAIGLVAIATPSSVWYDVANTLCLDPFHSAPLQVSLKEATYGQEISRGCLSAEDRYLLCEDKREHQGARFNVRCCYEDHCNDAKDNKRRIELRDTGASKSIN